ncbi:MAG: zinc-binding alcohol dehydrogenase [Beijerinckiaceae bacterium]|nr:zinc-binding alcohol dehydrogenase [Beijerinckiaceae bacterium]
MPEALAEPVSTALWYVGVGRAELRRQALPTLADGHCRVRMLHSAISRGTESLVFAGRVPEREWQRMRAPHQEGDFPFPVKYGYAAVGVVEQGPESHVGRCVFALHPHQDVFDMPADALTILPPGLPPRRAVLAANMETALNGVWDGAAGPADRIAVVGAGVVGALVAYLCGRLPGACVTLIDIDPAKKAGAETAGVRFATPEDAPRDCDVVFHASGHPSGLDAALDLAGDEARIVELSWYGAQGVTAHFGGAFHSRRLQLVSSQVGQVSPSRRPRFSYSRRLEAALGLLRDERLDSLLARDIPLNALPAELPRVFAPGSGVLAQTISYPPA